jgi:hypothetical protein
MILVVGAGTYALCSAANWILTVCRETQNVCKETFASIAQMTAEVAVVGTFLLQLASSEVQLSAPRSPAQDYLSAKKALVRRFGNKFEQT